MQIELNHLRGETYKIFDNGNGTRTYSAHCKPIHYKDDWVNGSFLDIDESSKIEYADYTYYDKLPYKLKIFKNKIGYEIESKRTGDKYIVELNRINNLVLTNTTIKSILANKDLLEFEFKINSNGVGLWKHLKTALSPKVFRWKITEFAKPEFNTTKGALNFKYDTQAIALLDGSNLTKITTQKTEINSSSFYWTETALSGGISIDTDVTYYSSTADGHVYASDSVWATVRGLATGTVSAGATYNDFGAGSSRWVTDRYYMHRGFFYFDCTGIPDNATIASASLSLYGVINANSSVCAMKGTQADTLANGDFDSFTGDEYGHVAWGINTYKTISLNAQGIADIIITAGTTKICTREYNHDYLNVDSSTTTYGNGCYFAEYTGDTDPKLDITYEVPSESPSISPSISPSESPSISPSLSPSASASKSASPSVSPSLSPSASVSPSISPSASESPSISPSISVSPSVSPSASESPSLSPSMSMSPSWSPSASPSPSISPSLAAFLFVSTKNVSFLVAEKITNFVSTKDINFLRGELL